MGDGFKKLDKKTIINIAGALIIGVVLLIMSSSIFKPGGGGNAPETTDTASTVQTSNGYDSGYEEKLEKRLEEALCLIEGAGKVKVMLTLSYGREIVVAEDKTTNESVTNDTDTQGGGRTMETSSVEARKIIIDGSDGVSAPLVLREVQPKIEGVIIIAEGGDNVFVKQALTSAAETVLGLDIAKVQVSKMRS
ncbi:MAG: hypothetical protein LBS84_10140 [Clostridiales bacterium]|jgi:stage III sporulation protein AG|nr:hypothetical protein [Clostridiales bacterium]